MYSTRINKALKEKGIGIGDRVRIKRGDEVWEGVLLPRPEGNPNHIVIKLDSGYNVGIDFKNVEIKLIEKRKKPKKEVKIPHNPDLPTVTLIHTGGTIASRVDYETGGVSAGFTEEDLVLSVPELFDEANVKADFFFNKMSEDMNYKDWQKLARETVKQLENSYGVVIAHGTDTLHYTASALSFMIEDLGKPVILVGSQRSSDRPSSDAFLNLLNGFRGAKLDISGVFVGMHDTVSDESTALIRGTRARKLHTSRRDAFKPVNDDYAAKISWDGKASVAPWVPRRRDTSPTADVKFEPKTALVKVHPNFSHELIDFLVDKGYKGIVIEGTGLGHVSVNDKSFTLLPSIERALSEGVFVGMTSQCVFGRVHPSVYANLRKLSNAGVVYLEDMLSETALVKLGWLLGHDLSLEEVKNKMLENISGEISNRSIYTPM